MTAPDRARLTDEEFIKLFHVPMRGFIDIVSAAADKAWGMAEKELQVTEELWHHEGRQAAHQEAKAMYVDHVAEHRDNFPADLEDWKMLNGLVACLEDLSA